MSSFCRVHCNSKVDIGKSEFGLLYLKGFVNFRGQIAKSRLKEAEEYLQKCGWNGVFPALHDKNAFEKFSDVIELVVDFDSESNSNSQIYIDEHCFSLLLKKEIIDDKGQILKSRLKEAEEYLQECGWNSSFVELHSKNKFDKLSDVIEVLTY